MSKFINKKIRVAFFLIGAVFLALLLKKIGIKDVLYNLKSLGWRFIYVLIISFCWYPLYTLAWRQFLGSIKHIPFLQLLRIKLAGEAVNTLTPLGFIGGDPARIYLLRNSCSLSEGAASVVVDRTVHTLAILLVVFTTTVVAFVTIDRLPPNIQYGMPIVLLIAGAFMGFILIHQRRGIFTLLVRLCQRLKLKRTFSDETIQKIEKLDSHITSFHHNHPAKFWLALFYHTAGRLLGVAEIYVIGKAASSEFTWLAALFLCGLAPIVNFLFAFIPGALGVLEGAYSAVLYFLGIDPSVGISIQVVRRARSAFWIGIGLLALGAAERQQAMKKEELLADV